MKDEELQTKYCPRKGIYTMKKFVLIVLFLIAFLTGTASANVSSSDISGIIDMFWDVISQDVSEDFKPVYNPEGNFNVFGLMGVIAKFQSNAAIVPVLNTSNYDINVMKVLGTQLHISPMLFIRFNKEQLVAILAHEFGHVVKGHYDHIQWAKENVADCTSLSGFNMNEFQKRFLKLRREEEYEADLIGVELLIKLGLDPSILIEALEVLKPEQKIFEWMIGDEEKSDHPFIDNRITILKEYLN